MTVLFRTALTALILLLPASLLAQDITGVWRTEMSERGYLEVEVTECGSALCGTIVLARNPQGVSGPYEHLGNRIFWDMTPSGTRGSWEDGKIWDPRNGRTFNSRMRLENGQLVVSGCVVGICQSQTWLRVR